MLIVNLYGRVGKNPVERQTRTGKPMASASVAVDVTGKDAEPQPLWVSVLAFGAAAESLLQVNQGDTLAAMGRLSRGVYTAKDGSVRESWTLVADAILSARTARAGKCWTTGQREPRQVEDDRNRRPPAFDDPIPF